MFHENVETFHKFFILTPADEAGLWEPIRHVLVMEGATLMTQLGDHCKMEFLWALAFVVNPQAIMEASGATTLEDVKLLLSTTLYLECDRAKVADERENVMVGGCRIDGLFLRNILIHNRGQPQMFVIRSLLSLEEAAVEEGGGGPRDATTSIGEDGAIVLTSTGTRAHAMFRVSGGNALVSIMSWEDTD